MNFDINNPIFMLDGYKLDHRRQYPQNTTSVYSNFTPRGSRIPDQKEIIFFGLQYFLDEYMTRRMNAHFFNQPKDNVISEYRQMTESYLGPNGIGTDHIAALHDLGYVPLEFRALPEGSMCPLRVPCLTVENTHPDFYWMTNYFETILSTVLWKACTSATTAARYRKLLNAYAKKTGGSLEFVPWQGHDFSMRGMAGLEDAMLSGAGHLTSFTGTDTIPAMGFLARYYDATGLVGGSVPATEHSVMCAGGKETEINTLERLLDLYPSGILSVVSDTWDFWKVLTSYSVILKQKIMARNGKLVFRPDSGDPVKIICGDPESDVPHVRKGAVETLWEIYGGTVNSAGFKELDPHVGLIYGDAITYERANEILQRLAAKGFASTNVVFGIGSFTYVYVTRDTYGFAVKATHAVVNGESLDLFKDPVTDNGEKKSARGRLAVLRDEHGTPYLINQATPAQEASSILRPVWRNGAFLKSFTLDDVRKNVLAYTSA